MSHITNPLESRFVELLERVGALTPDEDEELRRLSCELDALDALDEQIREGFWELDMHKQWVH